jgi:hypothetical protein
MSKLFYSYQHAMDRLKKPKSSKISIDWDEAQII